MTATSSAHPWRVEQGGFRRRPRRRRGLVDEWETDLLADVTRLYEATRAEETGE